MVSISRGLFKWIFKGGATLEDFADRLNHVWTFGLLILLACIVSWKQGYNKPINCWVPAQFTRAMTDYSEQCCWNSYFIQYPRDVEDAELDILKMFNISESLPFIFNTGSEMPFVDRFVVDEDSSKLEIMSTTRTLYQWLPLILIFQALLFKLPNIIMYLFHGYSGINFDKVAGLTAGFENLSLNDRSILSRKIGRYIYNWCRPCGSCLPWRHLSFLWLLVKILYCVNVVIQMSVLNIFLRTTDPPLDNSTSYGDVINDNLFDNNASLWRESPVFPRKVLCDFEIRQLANVHRYTVQCFLPLNSFNEFMYMFIWVWMVIVSVVTCGSLAVWFLRTLLPVWRKRYITRALEQYIDKGKVGFEYGALDKLCSVIGEDGVMVLKLTAANSSDMIVAEAIHGMWQMQNNDMQGHLSGSPSSGQILSTPAVRVSAGAEQSGSAPEVTVHPVAIYPPLETGGGEPKKLQ